jgi:hypothetical protein
MYEPILVLDIDKLVVIKGTHFPHADRLQAGDVDSTSCFALPNYALYYWINAIGEVFKLK